jgi:hypothetical protein
MRRSITALTIMTAALPGLAHGGEPQRFDSCADLRAHIDAMKPYEELRVATVTLACKEPPNPSADGLRIDFGGSTLRVADDALRPGIVIGDLQTPPRQRHQDITILNLKIDGNGANQSYECWGGPCDAAANSNPLWKERSNGVTVNGCDGCAVINVQVTDARSGGMTVVSSERLLVDGFRAERSCFDGLAAYHTHHSLFRNVVVENNDYAGFSFDGDFSHNRFEDFVARNNHDQGMFIRDASAIRFVRGLFAGNAKNGVYFDQDDRNVDATCASDITLAGVTLRGNGQYGAWLDFPCKGNRLVASALIDNREGCLGGREAGLIGQSDSTCSAPASADAGSHVSPGVRPICRRGP